MGDEVYELIASHTTDLVCLHDHDNRIRFANDSALNVLGYPPQQLLGKKLTDFLTKNFVNEMDSPTLMRLFNHPVGRIRYEVRQGDGSLRWLETTFTSLEDQANQGYRFLSTSRDITESVQLTDDLMQALSAEQELSKLKSNLYSVASHEFKTPLAVIQANIEMLKIKSSKEQLNAGLATMEAEIDRLNTMIGDMLELKKMTSGQRTFNPTELNLEQLIREVIQSQQAEPGKEKRFLFEPSGKPFKVEADYSLLRYVFSNLISNANKFSPGQKTVDIHLYYEYDQVRLEVTDYGIGIPKEEQPAIFQSFYRAQNAGHISGTGVGLSIVAEFVKLHAGKISVKSNVGEGSTFTVKLPKQIST
ncbi:MAG: PAS domain-containing sensor histidine kinase [Schleiferiaceae bacterium]|jgi:PAS domain S-box-containing protein|nr:PAS domain-containing sensor histidine kinase [Schleiferiaceae bacterium]MDR9442004.1 PAS domain-containing sensor histidine kinase [Schleiferiaceae bacterium]